MRFKRCVMNGGRVSVRGFLSVSRRDFTSLSMPQVSSPEFFIFSVVL